ncbi:2-oxoisovalerate dehydrogenase E2 component (dihydrolipoyl transacylase) [Franzmannia pantelleriensis]|uniref:Dihydrolipoamide acetyltransferase component of pyruvate dehydrogenase complex n=1 Tax=Franzmannia pantelleriensis TaxID=48727 RepID=A0A1G9ML79_9GAMM|nr:2-oxo acid dehydrogenase subunit E2 [Halomonas pantelleriensis]SDL74677.1 2-oxoisovalerate dehydrogenase E2 component (dihydrolipoyl transacylase) [Halomonas pantelleriensis]
MSEFKLPDIGEGIVECEVVKWLVSEGDEIQEDQPVVEVMTDKALVEITAPESGRVTALHYAEGESARVHSSLFSYQVAAGDDAAEVDSPLPAVEARSADSPLEADTAPAGERLPATPRTPASPAVRRLARELGVALDQVEGSGKEGRVLKEDLYALQQPRSSIESDVTEAPATRVETQSGLRAAMARHMREAVSIPHFHYGEEIDVTALLALHARLKVSAEAQGQRLTLMALFMKSLSLALAEHPRVNASYQPDSDAVHFHEHCHVGMAVDSPSGLIVPVVKHVEGHSLLSLAAEIARLTELARDGRVTGEDLKGATITLSNIGALGGTYATPIISAPQVAIGAIGRVQRLPRFDADGEVVSRAIMTVTWAGDHRVLDGGDMARFCLAWKGYLEAPESMLLHLG